jgi:CheY-like chemotaxis protein
MEPVILCVDDEATALMIRKLVLEQAGFRVLTASSAQQALEVLTGTPVDLVLSDHLMPDTTGARLAAMVKELQPRTPFLLLSGVNDLPAGAEAADGFMSKLEGPEAMIVKVRSLLKKE